MIPTLDAPQPPPHVGQPTSWSQLAEHVGARLENLRLRAAGTSLESDVEHIAKDAAKLCDHVAYLHQEAHRWFTESSGLRDSGETDPAESPAAEVQRAAVTIHREQHEQSDNPLQVIKALFMWVDTPEERVRESDTS